MQKKKPVTKKKTVKKNAPKKPTAKKRPQIVKGAVIYKKSGNGHIAIENAISQFSFTTNRAIMLSDDSNLLWRAFCNFEKKYLSSNWKTKEEATEDAAPHIAAGHNVQLDQQIS